MSAAAGRTLSWQTFAKALATNPCLRLLPSKSTKGAMVYCYAPNNPESDDRGLWEIMAVPSPTFFRRFPFKDFIDDDGKWVRGYNTFFKKCLKMRDAFGKRLFNPEKIKALIPDAYANWRGSKIVKDGYLDSLLSTEQKQALKLRAASKRIAGYGDPIGGKRETNTIYTF